MTSSTPTVRIETTGNAGRITLTRPKALNALDRGMCLAVTRALDSWAENDTISLVILAAEGDKAFCAGGDLAKIYHAYLAGDIDAATQFWRDEYRMNARLANFPKPIVSLMQGYVMGGGVGLGCHVSHRIACESTQMAMPEGAIGLIPDVGATRLLANAPGRVGLYMALSGARLDSADAIHAGFADWHVPRDRWPELINALADTGDTTAIGAFSSGPEKSAIATQQAEIDRMFSGYDPRSIIAELNDEGSELALQCSEKLQAASPLSLFCSAALIKDFPAGGTVEDALHAEFRFTSRACEYADLIEGIRAVLIDKDRTPMWQHQRLEDVTEDDIEQMLASLGARELSFRGRTP
ncbi:enoyl-CoA hydratase/isomerase family protein [Qingshengfaniella alkalisoli]|uniref:3-hydroxyisobutyryl-CoA hydrolase n=1 Tax=Qingshengfaniella alkalisoli TaxID=2599296 RepID=A0A5B8JA96_9RHOB|nr:enoyl-CoA hydratase/isomerase family protein [Qingshengfaniella alkalisoli]QDY71227.1 enoyl-CoA hydratase/isomerase family protein [Qingshengfaniella alkalisoli]